MRLPEEYVGADLYWWRCGPGVRTLVTIASELWAEPLGCDEITLSCALFDVSGTLRMTWSRSAHRDEVVFLDSDELATDVTEGVLAVFVIAEHAKFPSAYTRLFGTVDWITDRDVVTLHSDQAVIAGDHTLELTEIVFDETEDAQTSLVFLNGPIARPAGSVRITVVNHAGEARTATDLSPVPPFALQRVRLAELFPGLAEFAAGQPATLLGELDARRTFTRPYVVTEVHGRSSAYHAGNRYDDIGTVPAALYKVLGRGESNPGAVWHDDTATTFVNVFHAHGSLEGDFAVDAFLYDESGALVAQRDAWLTASRRGPSRGAIAELLPEPARRFRGHIALRFAPGRDEYPGRLQMLIEYRTKHGAARSMLWSDRWNSLPRSLARRRVYKACYRVFYDRSHLAVTNCGVDPSYAESAPLRIVLRRGRDVVATREWTLAPNATLFEPVERLLPGLLAEGPLLAIVESEYDLAAMQFTENRTTGSLAAEHLMAVPLREGERMVIPCGA